MGSTVWSMIEMTREMEGLNIHNLSFIEWEHLDLSVARSEVVCLLGDSGSGKSLLLRAIADLVVNEGDVSLWGKRRESFSPPEWRKRVGYLAAEILWWEETVNLHFSKPPSQEDLEKLNLPHDAGEWAPKPPVDGGTAAIGNSKNAGSISRSPFAGRANGQFG